MPATPTPADLTAKPKAPGARSLVGGFREFISQYNVVPLAVAVVIGNAVNDVVKSLVENLITPLISLLTPQGKLQGFQFTFHDSTFKIGAAVSSFITFMVIAWVVYVLAKFVLRNEEILKKK